jgi:trans-aconitate methyltransferase
MCSEAIVDLYERHAHEFDRDRGRSLWERSWLDRFVSYVAPSSTVLDIGCGTGEPMARYLIEAGLGVAGVDSSPSMIEMSRNRFPHAEWLVADMRALAVGRQFGGVLAWDSFFHLRMDEQRAMFARFAAHALPGAPLMFTSGTSEGESIGSYCGEPLYHASLNRAEYAQLLASNGFSVQAWPTSQTIPNAADAQYGWRRTKPGERPD